MVELIEGVTPPPLVRKPKSKLKYPFSSMKIGDSFFVPGKTRNTLAPYASTMAKVFGYRLRTQMVYMRESLEGWKPATKDDPEAVLGIGVFRVK